MKPPKILSKYKAVIGLAYLSWGAPAYASTCDIGQWIGGVEFGACPTQTGLELNRRLADSKKLRAFRLEMTQRLNITVAQYNADFPFLYAQWQREQNLIASHRSR